MKRQLLENAYEAWVAAIKYCDAISNGMGTLFYQKNFVSSLQNAVELFMKQIMLDQGDHKVAKVAKVKNKKDAKLYLDYWEANDLNRFFGSLSNDALDKFYSIEFNSLVEHNSKMKLQNGTEVSIHSALKLLQKLRNRETHFMIHQADFLSENDFVTLHNFMIDFFKIMKSNRLLPFWGEALGKDNRLVFDRAPISSFSYLESLRKSALAQLIIQTLNGSYDYGSPTSASYDIASELCARNEEFINQFDDLWTIIEMLQSYNCIQYKEFIDQLPEELDPYNQHPNVNYIMEINL